MKNFLIILLMFSMLFSLSACGIADSIPKEKIKEVAKETVDGVVKEVKEDIKINKDAEGSLESISLHKIGLTVKDLEELINNRNVFADGVLFVEYEGIRYELLTITEDEIDINIQAFKEAKDNKALEAKFNEAMDIFKGAIKEFINSEKVQNGKQILDNILEDIEEVTTSKDSPLYSPILEELKNGKKN